MKIGTINFHRSYNYGALMVTYSLLNYLKKIGIQAHPIDYFPEHHTSMYPIKDEAYDKFINKYLKPFYSPEEHFDLIIYGADTIWEYYQGYGYDGAYWGDETLKSDKKITFSASGTMKNFSNESDNLFKKNLDKFSAISVREDVLRDYIQKYTKKQVFHTCDPTFLLTKEDYSLIIDEQLVKEQYAIVYNRQLGAKLLEASENVQNKTGLHTVVLKGDGCLYECTGKLIRSDIGPAEFLNLIKYSSYVLAASFHAVAFSCIFEKNFNTIMKSGAERVESILRVFGLENRRIQHTDEIDFSDKIDYQDYNFLKRKNDYIQKSTKYLRDEVEAFK